MTYPEWLVYQLVHKTCTPCSVRAITEFMVLMISQEPRRYLQTTVILIFRVKPSSPWHYINCSRRHGATMEGEMLWMIRSRSGLFVFVYRSTYLGEMASINLFLVDHQVCAHPGWLFRRKPNGETRARWE
jgi:hypothetical protein